MLTFGSAVVRAHTDSYVSLTNTEVARCSVVPPAVFHRPPVRDVPLRAPAALRCVACYTLCVCNSVCVFIPVTRSYTSHLLAAWPYRPSVQRYRSVCHTSSTLACRESVHVGRVCLVYSYVISVCV